MTKTLDSILKIRFHGAVNIRGIRYQVLYSLGRAFELYDVVAFLREIYTLCDRALGAAELK